MILDPHHKFLFIEFSFDAIYDDTIKYFIMKELAKNGMQELFYKYKVKYGTHGSPTPLPLGSTLFSKYSQSGNSLTS